MWIVLSINNSRYQSWQVSVLIWSIELSISYVSLKSDNITCVDMTYVLAKTADKIVLKYEPRDSYLQVQGAKCYFIEARLSTAEANVLFEIIILSFLWTLGEDFLSPL